MGKQNERLHLARKLGDKLQAAVLKSGRRNLRIVVKVEGVKETSPSARFTVDDACLYEYLNENLWLQKEFEIHVRPEDEG